MTVDEAHELIGRLRGTVFEGRGFRPFVLVEVGAVSVRISYDGKQHLAMNRRRLAALLASGRLRWIKDDKQKT